MQLADTQQRAGDNHERDSRSTEGHNDHPKDRFQLAPSEPHQRDTASRFDPAVPCATGYSNRARVYSPQCDWPTVQRADSSRCDYSSYRQPVPILCDIPRSHPTPNDATCQFASSASGATRLPAPFLCPSTTAPTRQSQPCLADRTRLLGPYAGQHRPKSMRQATSPHALPTRRSKLGQPAPAQCD